MSAPAGFLTPLPFTFSPHHRSVEDSLDLLRVDTVEKGKFGSSSKNCRAVEAMLSNAAGAPAENAINPPAIIKIELGSD
jgi:hypothetical protein